MFCQIGSGTDVVQTLEYTEEFGNTFGVQFVKSSYLVAGDEDVVVESATSVANVVGENCHYHSRSNSRVSCTCLATCHHRTMECQIGVRLCMFFHKSSSHGRQ